MRFETLELPLGESAYNFNIEKAVCNHGYFMMAPNRWLPLTKTFERPLRLADQTTSVKVSISHPPNSSSISIRIDSIRDIHLSSSDRDFILEQVARMLRISEKDTRDVIDFHKLHFQAKNVNFGRMFRSPSLFEDIIKTILLCNCTWRRTLQMCEALCKLQWQHTHDPHTKDPMLKLDKPLDNFPNAKELVNVNEHILKVNCNLGYRADYILELAKEVENGIIDLEMIGRDVEGAISFSKKVSKKIMKIKGIGPFATASILMCVGYYKEVPVDSETINILKKVHKRKKCGKKTMKRDVEAVYGKYSPFQCLAYWFDLSGLYEAKFGKLSEMESTRYHEVSSSFHSKAINSKGRSMEQSSVSRSKKRFKESGATETTRRLMSFSSSSSDLMANSKTPNHRLQPPI